LSIPYNFITVHWREMKILHLKLSNASLKRFTDYLETLQNNHPELVTFDLPELKKWCWNWNVFDSSIPQGYGVGSSALVAAIYDRYAQDKITVLENLTREKLLQLKKYILSNGSFFTEKQVRSFK
jgi:mevalonate kinase